MMLKMGRSLATSKKSQVFLLFLLVFLGYGFQKSQQIRSANLTSVSVTLSTPRLSFVGKLAAGNSVGSSIVTIVTTANGASSTTSTELAEGDTVAIGDGSGLTSYTVASASATNSIFTIKSPSAATLQSGDADTDDAVISTQSATHTVRFTTATAIPNGSFQILVPATTLSGSSGRADGIPDQDGFDFGNSAPTVTCPSDVSSTYDFVTGTATASSVTINSVVYHAFECQYSGAGGSGTAFDGTSQGAVSIASLINPSPRVSHVQGYADTYRILVRHLDSSDSIIDQTTVSVGNIESVRVTATVPPQLTFAILGVASGTSACGQTTDVTTTPVTIPFGEVSISAFTEAAQALTVSTNATSGFAVTIVANDQMGKNGGACAGDPPSGNDCIPDSDVGSMSHTTSQDWTSTTNKGLAYSLHDANTTTTEAFAYNESARTFSAKHLPDTENSQTAQTIFSATAPAENDNVYVCYRVIVSATQSAGDYENLVTYRATATF
jgi:hypothetical protein